MSTAVRLSNELTDQAKIQAQAFNRSIAGQIEFWSKIGKIAEENPDMTYSFIKDLLIGKEEVKAGKVEPYNFG